MTEQGYTDILACDKIPAHDTDNIKPTRPPFRPPESIDVSRFMKNENFLSEPVSNKKPTPTLTTHQQIKKYPNNNYSNSNKITNVSNSN